jgi:hypothetical protein
MSDHSAVSLVPRCPDDWLSGTEQALGDDPAVQNLDLAFRASE